jgi:hypothetical protein
MILDVSSGNKPKLIDSGNIVKLTKPTIICRLGVFFQNATDGDELREYNKAHTSHIERFLEAFYSNTLYFTKPTVIGLLDSSYCNETHGNSLKHVKECGRDHTIHGDRFRDILPQ